MNPKHIDRVQNDRRAVAPYNFVELPNKVVEAQFPLPEGDRYHLEHHTGRIECTLTTESLLYTRCGWSPEDFAAHGEKSFNDLPPNIKDERAKFFTNPASEKPIIPGSSIRGMLRTLVEIVSFSKIDRVTNNKLFYRSLGDPALKKIYQYNFVKKVGKVQISPDPQADCYRSKVHAGFLRKRGNSYVIEECGYGRIDRQPNNRVIPNLPNQANIPNKPFYQGTSPGKTPSWTYQHKPIYVDIDKSEKNYFFPKQFQIDKKTGKPKINPNNKKQKLRHDDIYLRFRKVNSASFTPAPDLQKGTLVITGDMQHKHLEFVFLDEKLNEYPVPEEMVRRFQDDDQVTKWQEKAYPKNRPSDACRQQDGYLRDGEPVFFLVDDDEKSVRFFGRAQMFRLPYDSSPLDFVPHKLRDNFCTDIAEAIFGFVRRDKQPEGKEQSRGGRVFVSDGILNSDRESQVGESQERKPQEILLSSPKPTTFQHYLVQKSADKIKLKHYASTPPSDTEPGETVIRGHKLYWHKPAHIEVQNDASESQTSLIKPIDEGINFSFSIYFENLTQVELGALLWVLSLSSNKSETLGTGKTGEQYCFSLGMGKPYGLGAVKISYELYLSDRTARYSNLFDGTQWKTGEEDQSQTAREEEESVKAFEKCVLDGICCEDYPQNTTREQLQHLNQLPRIEMLLAMLQCDSPASPHEVEYMKLDGFRERKVLPTPLDIKKTQVPSNFSKPKLRIKSERDRDENGSNTNMALQRPPKPRR